MVEGGGHRGPPVDQHGLVLVVGKTDTPDVDTLVVGTAQRAVIQGAGVRRAELHGTATCGVVVYRVYRVVIYGTEVHRAETQPSLGGVELADPVGVRGGEGIPLDP